MKISKKSVLIMGGILCTASFGLLYVSADRELFMNPRNAIQYMENVKFIDETSDTTATLKKSIYNDFLRIETNNLILGDAGNSIEFNVNNSSILGGKSNTIKMGSKDNVIIGGSENTIQPYTVGNTIIGGNNNMVSGGSYLTIIGGNHNETNGRFNTIIGGSNNKYTNGVDNSVIMGNDSSVGGNNSVALGSSSNIEANNSFLWTDGSSSDTLTNDNVFAIMASNGAIIDTDEAHSSAKLTLGKSLILSKNENQSSITCGGGKGGGIIKIEKSEDANQMCLCSCDGYGWNSMSKGSCIDVCHGDNSTPINPPKCGNKVQRICTAEGITTYSGSCDSGNVIEGAGAYFVDKNNIVHRSCQGDDGTIASCTGSINQSQCIQVTSTFSCTNPPANAVLITGSDQNLTANTPGKLYSGVAAAGNSRCAYICDNTHIYTGYNGGTCITKSSTYSCTGTVSAYATLIPGSDQGLTGNTTRTIYPNAIAANGKKCAYLCNSETHEYKNGDCKAKPGVHECKKNPPLPDHATLWHPEITPSNSSTKFTYSEIDTSQPCRYHCDDGYSYNRINECLENKCQSTYLSLPDNAELWYPDIKPNNHTTNYFYLADKPEGAKACAFHCKENYIYDRVKNECIAKTQQKDCTGLPSNAEWVNGKFTQTWNGSAWTPGSKTPTYSSSNSVECSYQCNTNYDWNGSSCIKKQSGLTTTLESGFTSINSSIKRLAKNYADIKHFKRWTGNSIPTGTTTEIISTRESETPVYARYDKINKTIYYYTEADTIYINDNGGGMFEDLTSLIDISGVADFDTSKAKYIRGMFINCSSLEDISPLSKWNTSNVEDMSAMFLSCSSLEDISPLSKWNTSNVKDMNGMFMDCSSLEDISPLSKWNTSNVKDMKNMFYGAKNLTTVDLSNWDTSNVENMLTMFQGAKNLTTIDLSNWDTSNVKDMEQMFRGCNNLTTIYASEKFKTPNYYLNRGTFFEDTNLQGGNGTSYEFIKEKDKYNYSSTKYARIDKGPESSSPGYFTAK